MLTPERLLRLMIEFIFVLLGGLLIWLGLAGPAHGRTVDRHGAPWLVLSVALIVWGLRGLYKPGPVVAALAKLDARVVARASGRSHARDFARAVPLGWSDARSRRRIPVLRGMIASYLIFRPR